MNRWSSFGRATSCIAPAALTLAALAGGGGQIVFDEFPADDANGTIPPDRYAAFGVIFQGTDDSSTWGGLSNGDPGSWGLEGTAGPIFSGFNGGAYGVTIRFLSNVTGVAFDAARSNGSMDGVVIAEGYRNGVLMSSQTVTLGDINMWSTIAVGGLIDELVITGVGSGFHPFGIDNLRWAGAGSCPWDFDGDGQVGPADLAGLLAAWGNPFGPAELAALLAAWGPCDPCGPGAGPCNVPNGSPGCMDVDCCNLVCSMDPFCCDVTWDQLCADQALEVCFPCCQPGDLPEGEPCGSDTNGGCNSTPPIFREAQCNASYCGSAWADDGTRDTDWYRLTLTADTLVTATLASEFDGVVLIIDGLDTCTPVVVGSTGSSILCDPIGAAQACLPPGQYAVFVATAGFDGVPCGTDNNYRVSIMCEPCSINPCTPDAGSCIEPNGSPGCADVECCELVCAQDPFCCDVEWDQACANDAIELCLGCGPESGNCATPNGTPGCEDVECCLAVCANDPFCCDVEWDQACANQAIDICSCTPDAGNCYQPNGTPGCDINECCTLVCAEDPFCCATEWDTFCVSQAIDLCGDAACNSAAGPCGAPNGTPGCSDLACCNLVCDQDPFCCETEWDQLCADDAAALCN